MTFKALIIGLAGIALTGGAATAQDYPQLTLRQNNLTPATAGPALADVWFAEEVNKRSGGRITIQNFWAGAAGAPGEMLKLVGGGGLDIGTFPGSYFPAEMPFLAAPSALPLTLPSAEKADAIIHELWEKVPAYEEEARANNIYPLFFRSLNAYHLLCTSPVRTLADLRNKKIRTQGEFFPMAVQAIDAVPVNVLPGEFYEALQRGTVDCMLLPWDLLAVNRLYEVAKFGSTINFGTVISHGVNFNLARWNGLPDNVKALFREVAQEARAYALEAGTKATEAALATMRERGAEIIEFQEQEAFEAKLPDFLGIWQERMTAAGKGEAAAEAAALWKSLR